jgi:photosystem II stability/assembly factor-like uncharacterized protein
MALRQVRFVNSSIGYISGGYSGLVGRVWKTTDGGASWTMLSLAASNGMYSTFFTSLNEGYAADWDGYVHKTTDGGATWTTTSGAYYGSGVHVYFLDSSNGFTCSNYGTIGKTTDAGANWSNFPVSGTTELLNIMEFVDSMNGFMVGGDIAANTGRILYTHDQGNTWTSYLPGCARLYCMDFYDASLGYACGLNGTILRYRPLTPVGIEQNESTIQVLAYPVPASEYIIVLIEGSQGKDTFLQIFDSSGAEVISRNYNSSEEIRVETSGLSPGMYQLRVRTGEITETSKIVIQ